MASITCDVSRKKCAIRVYDTRKKANLPLQDDGARSTERTDGGITIVQYSGLLIIMMPCFPIGAPDHSLILSSLDSSKNPFFHGSCAYLPPPFDELYITSNVLQPTDPSQAPIILISRVSFTRDKKKHVKKAVWSKLRSPANMPMPAGAVAYTTPDGKPAILYCSQGDFSKPSGLFQMTPGKPPEPVLTNSFGTEFGTVCAVAVQKNGNTRPVGNGDALWFVDAGARGFRAGFRPRPAMPPIVWRFVPKTGDLRAMTDDVKCPWGIALAPNGKTVYVTDSEPVGDDGPENMRAGIYAFDVIYRGDDNDPFLSGKRLFARPLKGIAKGLICDQQGNVFVACGDGVEIWDAAGCLNGVITTPTPATNVGWGRDGELFICAEQTLWRLEVDSTSPVTYTSEFNRP